MFASSPQVDHLPTCHLSPVQALRAHLSGSKHKEALERPLQDPADFFLHNGKWKRRRGEKRRGEGDEARLSKRERTRVNKKVIALDNLCLLWLQGEGHPHPGAAH